MREPQRDARPRIVELTMPARASLGDIAWPCHAYHVTLPIQPRGNLNLFEEMLLKLLALGRTDVDDLADTTCLPKDLVVFALLRLNDAGLVTAHQEPTDVGKAYLSQLQSAPPEYEGRTLFRELVGGQLLPVVYDGPLRCERLGDWHRGKNLARILKGTAGKEREVPLHTIRPKLSRDTASPTTLEVLWAARQHRNLGRLYAILRGGNESCPSLKTEGEISVHSEPELLFLRCQIIQPPGSLDFLITDPFGYGCSDVLKRAYERLLGTDPEEQEWLLKRKERALSIHIKEANSSGGEEEGSASARLVNVARRYPELSKLLHSLDKDISKSRQSPESSDAEAALMEKRRQIVQNLYGAIELGLQFMLIASKPNLQAEVICRGTHETNAALLRELSKRIGLTAEGTGTLLEVAPGRVRSALDGSAEMQGLIALSLVDTANDLCHPLRRLASRRPDWLSFISDLRRVRNAAAHGQGNTIRGELLEHFRARTYESLRVLLPDLELIATPAPQQESEDVLLCEYESRLKARIALERQFGVQAFARLDRSIGELLIGVETWLQSLAAQPTETVEVKHLVVKLASALQWAVYKAVSTFRIAIPADDQILIAKACRRAMDADFVLASGGLPHSLATVQPRRIRQTFNGGSASLGACAVMLLIAAPDDWLQYLAKEQPRFVLLLGDIAELRGHGNESLCMTPTEFLNIKRDTYQAMMSILEA